MNHTKFKVAVRVFILILTLTLITDPIRSSAYGEGEAVRLTDQLVSEYSGFTYTERLVDGEEGRGAVCEDGGSISIKSSASIGSVYIAFNSDPTEWTLTSASREYVGGKNGFLHEYADIFAALGDVKECVLEFDGYCDISEIYVFSQGEKPDWVQDWQPTLQNADMLLFVAHSDDDQLFFAGLIPLYCSEGYRVQVAYITYHKENIKRRHEFLNGLWTAGNIYYPMYGKFDDFRIDDLDETMAEYERRGTSYSDIEGYVTKVLRKTKPLVVVTHDINGEYGHGMHRMLSKMVCDSVDISGDASKYTESAKEYGVWTAKKIYLHLYAKNKLTLNIDTPITLYGGKTAFEISQTAFLKHDTQFDTWFYPWLCGTADAPITSSSQIPRYNPTKYGLYYTEVGYDTGENCMFENIVTYGRQEEFSDSLGGVNAEVIGLSNKADSVYDRLTSLENDAAEAEKMRVELMTLEQKNDKLAQDISNVKVEYSEVLPNEMPTRSDALAYVMLILSAGAAVSVGAVFILLPKKRTARKKMTESDL